MIDKNILNTSRALYYCLLSKFFIFQEDIEKRFYKTKEILAILIMNPLEENTKKSLENLLKIFNENKEALMIEEYDDIFFLPGSKTVKMTASYYHEGVELGKKRIEVKNFLAKTKIRRNEKTYKEPEDSLGFLLVFMNELIELIINGNSEYNNLQHCVFSEIINPFIDTFSKELFEHPKSNVYKDVAVILNAFIEFERLYFEVEKPKIVDVKNMPKFSRSKEEEILKNKARKMADKKK